MRSFMTLLVLSLFLSGCAGEMQTTLASNGQGAGVNEGGSESETPVIDSFNASATMIAAGQSVTLTWEVRRANRLTLNPGNIDLTGQQSLSLLPASTTSYTLTAANEAGAAQAQIQITVTISGGGGPNAVVPGVVSTPFPTLENISVEWAFSQDSNQNSVVSVRYRRVGESIWKNGMNLRLVPAGSNEGASWSSRHSGSIFDLQPATNYEIELSMADPDGGSEQRVVTARTRDIPRPMAGALVKNATPSNLTSVLTSAQPGEIVLLGPGSYSGFQVNVSGAEGRPIVIRGSTGAVIAGEIGIFSRNHIYLESLNLTGRIRFNGSNNISIVRSQIQAAQAQAGDGIVSYTRSENSYIADNIVRGVTAWGEGSFGVNGNNIGEGILVTGPGHVIMNNRVSHMRDGISFMEGSEYRDQYSIDVLNNDISFCADDGVEADFCRHNCRILRNRLTNNFIALSSQPSLGGPTYFIRNSVYNVVHIAFKLYRGSIGDVLLHNTVVKNGDGFGITAGRTVSRAFIANNLFIGGPGGTYAGFSSGSGQVAYLPELVTANSYMNYQAYGTSSGSFSGRIGSESFSSLMQLRSRTSEVNSVQVQLSDFESAVAYPTDPGSAYAIVDLRLRSGSVAENAALRIWNINDDLTGSGADIGAHEVGRSLPIYGPR